MKARHTLAALVAGALLLTACGSEGGTKMEPNGAMPGSSRAPKGVVIDRLYLPAEGVYKVMVVPQGTTARDESGWIQVTKDMYARCAPRPDGTRKTWPGCND